MSAPGSHSPLFVGVDVGTGSARAALVAATGKVLRVASKPIDVHNPKQDYYEQSSDQIWQAVCASVREICSEEDAGQVQAIGFDATCSLVIVDKNDKTIRCFLIFQYQNIIGIQCLEFAIDISDISLWLNYRMPFIVRGHRTNGFLFQFPLHITSAANKISTASLTVLAWTATLNGTCCCGWTTAPRSRPSTSTAWTASTSPAAS
jgi:hypothetical protein